MMLIFLKKRFKQINRLTLFAVNPSEPFGNFPERSSYGLGGPIWPQTIKELQHLIETGWKEEINICAKEQNRSIIIPDQVISELNIEEFSETSHKQLIQLLGKKQNYNAFSYLSISKFLNDLQLLPANKHRMLTLIPESLNTLPISKNQSLLIAYIASFNMLFGDTYGILTTEKVKEIFLNTYHVNIDYDPNAGYDSSIHTSFSC